MAVPREWVAVQSSNINGVKYDTETSTLYVEFKNYAQYAYDGVPFEDYEALKQTASPGAYLKGQIEPFYSYSRVG